MDIAAFRPPELLKSLPEGSYVSLKFRVALRMGHQYADPPHPVSLLPTRGNRPRRSNAEQRDELAPFHSMTSSARASSVGGTSRPIALAALRLMISSNLVGCSTGRF